jgi:carbonic anhydrase
MLNRRLFLKSLALSTGSLLLHPPSALADSWGYTGKINPENWGKLSPDFQACQNGTEQSPIDLPDAVDLGFKDLAIDYHYSPLTLFNNGLTLRGDYQPGSWIQLGDQAYELLQFHFHSPSEHQIAGKAFDMELHLVHRNQAGALVVIGVLIEKGKQNPMVQKIWDVMPNEVNVEKRIPELQINVEKLLPKDRSFYRYTGSLTTPPCSEGVEWIVMRETIALSPNQISRFQQAFPQNARPIQPMNQRTFKPTLAKASETST